MRERKEKKECQVVCQCWARSNPRAYNYILVFYMGSRPQLLQPRSYAFPDAFAESWMRNGAARKETRAKIWDAGIAVVS